jgi:hypothetical protein
MHRVFFPLLLSFLITVFSFNSANADWINLTGAENARNIAEIFVGKEQVKIQLEVYIEDMVVFEELVIFADQVVQIITDSGRKLPVRFDLVEPRLRTERPSPFAGTINPYTRMRIPGSRADKRVLYAELLYEYDEIPKSLTIVPPLDDMGIPKASIGFICYHEGVPVVDFRQLTNENILHLDWDDPWYSVFEKKQFKRTMQSGVRTYLYIEPYEVRHEILIRVKDVMTWMDFDLKGDEFIEEDEFNPVREQVARFFMEREKVLIDGEQGKPILDKTAYVESYAAQPVYRDTGTGAAQNGHDRYRYNLSDRWYPAGSGHPMGPFFGPGPEGGRPDDRPVRPLSL